jgi:LmeA-like phospholipid-binding
MPEPTDRPEPLEVSSEVSSGMISKILAPAIQFWLRGQVESVEVLELTIAAGNRQILSGTIPAISLSSQQVIYQGLHLSEVALTGQNIRVNLSQILRGKALQLLEPIAIQGRATLHEADLNASLEAPLLANAIQQFLGELTRSSGVGSSTADLNLQNIKMRLLPAQINMRADLLSASGTATEIAIRTGLRLTQPNQLQLHKPQLLLNANAKRGLPLKDLDGYSFDLGTDTNLSEVTIAAGTIICAGQLLVQP